MIRNAPLDHGIVVTGKYFHFNVFLVNDSSNGTSQEDVVAISDMALREVGLTQAICLPSSCEKQDVFNLLQDTFRCSKSLHFIDDIGAQTLETTSFRYKWNKLTSLQMISIYILSSLVVVTIIATVFPNNQWEFLDNFNARDNCIELFYVKKGEKVRSLFLDANKSIVHLTATAVHIVTCAESPRSVAYFSHTNFPIRMMKNPIVQLMAFEGGFTGLAFFS